MKKEKRKIQILRQMTEGDIKNLGGNLWVRRNAKWLILAGVLGGVWLLAGAVILKGWIGVAISVLPIMVFCLIWMVRVDKEGKFLWNQVKNKKEPVDLG